jgi:hypothetical protein
MSIKLRILSMWLPKFISIKELEKTSNLTNKCLERLLKEFCPDLFGGLGDENQVLKGNLEERRIMMAVGHNIRVKILIKCLGKEKAIEKGREEMFKTGFNLGVKARKRLGVGENIYDVVKAARILYSILGIEFTVENTGRYMVLKVKRCALADHYSPETCIIMSAADEGVLRGLNDNMGLKFVERISEGAEECTACINLKQIEMIK